MAWNQINQEVSALCPSEVSLSYSIDGPICRAVNDKSDDDSFCCDNADKRKAAEKSKINS